MRADAAACTDHGAWANHRTRANLAARTNLRCWVDHRGGVYAWDQHSAWIKQCGNLRVGDVRVFSNQRWLANA